MSEAALVRQGRVLPMPVVLVGISVGLAVLGFALRFLIYRYVMPGADPAEFFKVMCRWDCEWYVRLAETGYDPFPTPQMINAGNWAFFPLYPMLIGLLRIVTGLPAIPLAAMVGTLCCIGASLLAWPLLHRRLPAYTLFSAFLLCGPFSFYFTTFFTETLFVLLTLAVFLALKARRLVLAALFAAALSATRIVGVFIVFAILWEVWVMHRERGGRLIDFLPTVLREPRLVLVFAVAPLGLFAYMLFLHLHIGDALAFQHVQRAWGRPTGLPPVFIWNGLASVPQEGWWPTASQWLGGAAVLGYVLVGALFLTRRTGMGIFALIALTLPLFAGLASMIRFVVGLAPMPLVLADLVGRTRTGFVIGLLVMLASTYLVTEAWLDWRVALV